ncbi:MAG TPA: hypothetical protein VMV94_06790 [Phycisphaerae bacterium]|nr:hypothetical protein [Phycisphaerae bacterium]
MIQSISKLIGNSAFCSAVVIGLVILFVAAPAEAQITTQNATTAGGTTPTGTTVTGQTPIATVPTSTTPTTTSQQPSTTAPTGTRQPTVVTNQFNANSGGAIAARSPGKMVEGGLAEATGQLTIPGDATEEPHNWYRQTFDMIAQNMLTMFSDILTGINSFISGLSGTTGGGGTSTTTFVVPPNAATTWSNTSQTIP